MKLALAHAAVPELLNGSASELSTNSTRELGTALVLSQGARLSEPQAELNDTAARVVILVLASASSRSDLLRETWAGDARNVHLVGPCPNCTFHTDHERDWHSLPGKVLQMFQTAAAAFPDAEVFVKVDMDTYVFYENLLRMLLRHRKGHGVWPDYVGSVYEFADGNGTTVRYCSGGAGYIVSRRAVESLNQSRCQGPFDPSYEDVTVGRCLSRGGILPLHSTGFLGDKVEDALRHWLDKPMYANHVGDPSVPAALITAHGYKDPYMLRAVDLLSRARQQPEDTVATSPAFHAPGALL